MSFLLDVNVLIALTDDRHLFSEAAHAWFQAEGHVAWATCPITENGLVRVMGGKRYPGGPGRPGPIVGMLARLREQPGHAFWPDTVSLASPQVNAALLGTSDTLTDTYLLALAVARGGRLATFDRRMRTDAVVGGKAALFVIPA